jgi:hypothetical protein
MAAAMQAQAGGQGVPPNPALHLTRGGSVVSAGNRFCSRRGQVNYLFGQAEEISTDVDVYWKGRLVARLRNYMVDYYKIFGEWVPAGDSAFEQHLRAMQTRSDRM